MALRPAYGFEVIGLPGSPYGNGLGQVRQARLVPPRYATLGAVPGEQLALYEEQAEIVPVRRRPRPPKGKAKHCKVMLVTMYGRKGRKRQRRKICWDAHGTIVSNKPSSARGKGHKRVCKTKCPKGAHRVCKGGHRTVKGKRVCKKFVCRRS